MFPKIGGFPQIIDFNRGFHCKPSILGYDYFWKHLHEKSTTERFESNCWVGKELYELIISVALELGVSPANALQSTLAGSLNWRVGWRGKGLQQEVFLDELHHACYTFILGPNQGDRTPLAMICWIFSFQIKLTTLNPMFFTMFFLTFPGDFIISFFGDL